MGNKINLGNRILFAVFVVFLANAGHTFGSELIEVNRVVAKVNDRIVTWGEIQSAMNLLSFTDKEKKERAGEFVDGKRSYGVMDYKSGNRYEGDWDGDYVNGKGIMYYNDGSKYDGEWENDLEHGRGKYIDSDGSRYKGNFEYGCFHGFGLSGWARRLPIEV